MELPEEKLDKNFRNSMNDNMKSAILYEESEVSSHDISDEEIQHDKEMEEKQIAEAKKAVADKKKEIEQKMGQQVFR